jgi:RNA polymerase sigma-70 factor (sigma-E family)
LPVTFEEFAAQRLDPLLRYATALACDPHLAQDIVQEVLLRAQQHWPRIAEADQPAAYVRRMVTNEYLSWRRRRAAKDVALAHPDLDRLGPAVADPTRLVDERDAMLARIARLPRKQRAAVVLRYYENLTDDEIAAQLGCTAGTVRSHVSRALSTLRASSGEEQRPVLPVNPGTKGIYRV